MNKNFSALLAMFAAIAVGQSAITPTTSNTSAATRSVAEAQIEIASKPTQYSGYNLLATALLSRARETSDASYYMQAEDAVKKSLELAPNNFETEKIRVSVLLGEQEFPTALEAAKALNKRVPDDVMVYGLLTDANVEIGNYAAAENAAQWTLNLRPGNLPAMIRASRLRELFGDAEGAYELMDLAYQSTPPTESEERAWLLTQLGHLRFVGGNSDVADKFLQQALVLFPGNPGALGNLAELRVAEKRYPDAVALLQERYQSVPRAANLYDLAVALQLAGHVSEAQKAFTEFELKSLQESDKKDNSNRNLIFYYADHSQPEKALKIAQQEFSWRHDVYTQDAYAWALHVNGEDADARKQIDAALAVGVCDAKLFLHAGAISLKLGDVAAAERYLKQATQLNGPASEQAQNLLAGIHPTSAQR